jgi:hypothetical protein
MIAEYPAVLKKRRIDESVHSRTFVMLRSGVTKHPFRVIVPKAILRCAQDDKGKKLSG